GHGNRPAPDLGAVVEAAGVPPSALLVETPGPRIAGHHGQPGRVEPLRDHLLGVAQQRLGGASPARARRHVHLLRLVLVHGHEADHVRADRGHGGRGQARRDALAKVGKRAVREERVGNVTQVPVPPALMPDLGDGVDVVGPGGAQCHLEIGTLHVIEPRAAQSIARGAYSGSNGGSMALTPPVPPRLPPWAMSVLSVVAAAGLGRLLAPWAGAESAYLLFAIAVVISARHGGLWSGLSATVFGGVLVLGLFVTTPPTPAQWWQLVVFLAVGAALSWLTQSLAGRAAVGLSHASERERLEAELAEAQRRTSELQRDA